MKRLADHTDAQMLALIRQHAVVFGGIESDLVSPRSPDEVAARPLADIASALGHPLAEASSDQLRGIAAALHAAIEASGRLVGFDLHAEWGCCT